MPDPEPEMGLKAVLPSALARNRPPLDAALSSCCARVVGFGDDADALERTPAQLGNGLMREHVIPHAASPPERTVTKVVVTYRRASAG
jgi:hypothetical protein